MIYLSWHIHCVHKIVYILHSICILTTTTKHNMYSLKNPNSEAMRFGREIPL